MMKPTPLDRIKLVEDLNGGGGARPSSFDFFGDAEVIHAGHHDEDAAGDAQIR